eukprot:358412-Chlamydomonas_euryale.AAC.2
MLFFPYLDAGSARPLVHVRAVCKTPRHMLPVGVCLRLRVQASELAAALAALGQKDGAAGAALMALQQDVAALTEQVEAARAAEGRHRAVRDENRRLYNEVGAQAGVWAGVSLWQGTGRRWTPSGWRQGSCNV